MIWWQREKEERNSGRPAAMSATGSDGSSPASVGVRRCPFPEQQGEMGGIRGTSEWLPV